MAIGFYISAISDSNNRSNRISQLLYYMATAYLIYIIIAIIAVGIFANNMLKLIKLQAMSMRSMVDLEIKNEKDVKFNIYPNRFN